MKKAEKLHNSQTRKLGRYTNVVIITWQTVDENSVRTNTQSQLTLSQNSLEKSKSGWAASVGENAVRGCSGVAVFCDDGVALVGRAANTV